MKRALTCLLVALVIEAGAADSVVDQVVAHAAAHPRGDVPFSFDHSAYQGNLSSLPIGVFDSGIGGLTVLEAILALDVFNNETLQPKPDGIPDFRDERFIYFGDQANMPYGNYPSAERTDYLRELILKDALFLLGGRFTVTEGSKAVVRRDKPPVKAIVIACNTATAYGLEDIRKAVSAWGLPVVVVGVVEAGARGVQELHQEAAGAVSVLATVGTCASGAYPKMIQSALGRAGRDIPPMVQQGSASLAGIIEGDAAFKETVAECASREVRELATTYRNSGATDPIRTVVLGCTHFPLVRDEIDAAFQRLRAEPAYAGLISADLTYVDPAEWTARELFRSLAQKRLRAKPDAGARSEPDQFYISIANANCAEAKLATDGSGGLDRDYKYGRKPGRLDLEDTVNVPLRPSSLPATSAKLVREKLPLVWARLSKAR